MQPFSRHQIPIALWLALLAIVILPQPALAQIAITDSAAETAPTDPEPVIEAAPKQTSDNDIQRRLIAIYSEIDALKKISVSVESGVVTLSGETAAAADADQAAAIAARVSGVVTVQNRLSRNLDIASNVEPAFDKLKDNARNLIRSLPLFGVALLIILLFVLLGRFLATRKGLWRRIAPNIFVADLMSTMVQAMTLIAGLVIALEILDATALLGAVLGSAGVVGLAIGFAMKDTVENYITSIMLSIRQPFRANDHVVINGNEGRVIRLTSRATILMTLDGNHLRLPNSAVFRADILNYTRNPDRRLDFELGIDAEDDPADAMRSGIAAMQALDFILNDPPASARIGQVGDSNIVIRYLGWINQEQADFHKARSIAIREVKNILEAEGFGLPEPIYRLRFDSGTPLEIARSGSAALAKKKSRPKSGSAVKKKSHGKADHDVGIDDEIARKVAAERSKTGEDDALDSGRPIE